jgi:hypothetical protein
MVLLVKHLDTVDNMVPGAVALRFQKSLRVWVETIHLEHSFSAPPNYQKHWRARDTELAA